MPSKTRWRRQWLDIHRMTPPGEHFFFGYYDKFATNAGDQFLLALHPDFIDHLPAPDEPVTIGFFDLSDPAPRFVPMGRSHAWCWQQANMLQWLPEAPDHLAIHNDFRNGRYVAVIRDIRKNGRETAMLPFPIYTLDPSRPAALFLNFSRVYSVRPGYGYPNLPDPNQNVPAPETDGVWRLDLHAGTAELVLSIRTMAALEPAAPTGPETFHWVNHIQINPAGTRFACLHRYRTPENRRAWTTRLITADMDGANPRLLVPGPMVSHYDWLDAERILAYARPGPLPPMFYLIDDRTRPPKCPIPFLKIVGADVFSTDGHCNFSPDRRFFANDTYPQHDRKRTLMVVRWPDHQRIDIARLYAPPEFDGEFRCDLHPRWFRNSRALCFDSLHEGFRGIYSVDLSPLIDAG